MSKLGTRDQLGAYLREVGYPISDSQLDKLCMPSCGEGPPVSCWLGRRPLYSFEEGLRWIQSRTRPTRQETAAAPGEEKPAS
jgi:hypothetical protein